MGNPQTGRSGGWSLGLGSVAGIPVRVHFTFFLILGYFGFVSARSGHSVPRAILVLLLIFACVVLHELGHAMAARLFGVKTREIVLYPIGGIARLERMPTGKAELVIAIAGPLVNLALALGLTAIIVLGALDLPGSGETVMTGENLAGDLLLANVLLFLFNLVPAFPMDGGRILRATLSLALPLERATGIAAVIGQGLAMLFAVIGLWGGNPFLLLIALFVFLGAGEEAAFQRQRAALIGRTAREAMITRFETVAPQDSLGSVAERLVATEQEVFPVIDGWGRLAGVIPRSRVMLGLTERGEDAAALDFMIRELETVTPEEDLDRVVELLRKRPGQPVLVVEQGALVGMITTVNLAEFVEITRHSRARA